MAELKIVGPGDDGSTGHDPWALEVKHQRYFKKEAGKSETTMFSGRIADFHLRRIDEIIHSKIEPDFKTKTDVIQDAISMWLEEWDMRHPDGIGGEYSSSSQLDIIQSNIDRRNNYLDKLTKVIDAAVDDKDIRGLRNILVSIVKYEDEVLDAPQRYLDDLTALGTKVQRLVKEYDQ